MPGIFGGPFHIWEEKHREKRPNESRLDLLRKWVETLIKAKEVRSERDFFGRTLCGVSPYHHFSDDDIALLKQIAKDAGQLTDVDDMVSSMVREHKIADEEFKHWQKLQELVKELNTLSPRVPELEAQLEIQHQKLVELKEEIQQQRELAKLCEAERQSMEKCLDDERKQFESQLHQQRELAKLHEAERQSMEKRLDDERKQLSQLHHSPPDEYCDMIFTLELMKDPVVAADGFTYERKSIEQWFQTKNTSPNTGAALQHKNLIPNNSLRSQINQWNEKPSSTSVLVDAVGTAVDKAVTAGVSAVSAGVASINPRSVVSVGTAGVASINRRSTKRWDDCVIC